MSLLSYLKRNDKISKNMFIKNNKRIGIKKFNIVISKITIAHVSTNPADLIAARGLGNNFIQKCQELNVTSEEQILQHPGLDEIRNRVLDFNNNAALRDGLIIEVAVNEEHNMVVCQYLNSGEAVVEHSYDYTQPNPPVSADVLQERILDAEPIFGGVEYLTETSRGAFEQHFEDTNNMNPDVSPERNDSDDSAYESDGFHNVGTTDNQVSYTDNASSNIGQTENNNTSSNPGQIVSSISNPSIQNVEQTPPVTGTRKRSRSASFDSDEEEDKRDSKRHKKDDDDKGGPSSSGGSLGNSNNINNETQDNTNTEKDVSFKTYFYVFILEFISNIDVTLFL